MTSCTQATQQGRILPFADANTPSGFPMAILSYDNWGSGEEPRSLAELKIMEIAGSIRDKPEWWRKIADKEIVGKWRQETLQGSSGDESYILRQFEYALAENQWIASHFPGPSRPAAVDGVFSRDDLGGDTDGFLVHLLKQVSRLRSQPAIGSSGEDRHPGTPQMVDLVHPSLYCYERGKTQVLRGVGAEVMQMPAWEHYLGTEGCTEAKRSQNKYTESASGLQWLPSEFFAIGDHCEIKSYINSLHPIDYKVLYDLLGGLFVKALPLLEDSLVESSRTRNLRVPVNNYWSEIEPRNQGSDEDDDEDDRYYEDMWENRVFIPPEIPEFTEPEYNSPRMEVSLRDRPLQVIVKLASLELEPGESYDGGVWHVEGTLDERIVATACCYLESTNISGGDLEFRTSVCEPGYEQNDDDGIRNMYGLENEEALVQELGCCSTRAGRILAWPNTLQHRVGPVRLVDETLPGKRTICCFFLVDPTLRIRSTATVPPQQLAWLSKTTQPILERMGVSEPGVRGRILQGLQSESMLSYEQACERRQRLMDERQATYRQNGDEVEPFFVRHFSLCEH